MTIQLSDTVRNAILDVIESTIGASAYLYLRSGAQPANCAAADSGTLLATFTLPSDWMAAASGGTKAKSGTWSTTASTGGTIGHHRIKETTQTTCHWQGSCGQGSGDLSFDNATVTASQQIDITTFTWTAGNP